MMIFINAVSKEEKLPRIYAEGFIKLLNPVAPYITEEMWNKIGHDESIANESWPEYDEEKTKDDTVRIGVQVNGKVRGTIEVTKNDSEESIKEKAFSDENVKRHTEGKEIVKTIVIPGRIVNIVVK